MESFIPAAAAEHECSEERDERRVAGRLRGDDETGRDLRPNSAEMSSKACDRAHPH
ncbi:hypothetical protein HYPGJ_20065 [Hyphomicrobium sp. GJ21]|nr:hypothetical protein HYPGJ_20065 [Hyphomicrobium sp. GJ21]